MTWAMTALIAPNAGFTLGKTERCLNPGASKPSPAHALASHSLKAGTVSVLGPQQREKSFVSNGSWGSAEKSWMTWLVWCECDLPALHTCAMAKERS